jgi:UDP-N-acetyl-D-glucosamine dehydrogenase
VTPETISAYDCILIITDHDDVDYEMIGTHASLIVDTRNAMNRVPAERIKARCVKA